MRCVECLGEATIQVVGPTGNPMGTYCQPCLDVITQANQAFSERLEAWIAETPQAQMAPPFTTPVRELAPALRRAS